MKQVVRKTVAEANNVDTSQKIYHLVIDGNSVLKSSLVNKDAINSKGEEYGAILLFLRRVGQLLMKRDFDHCVVCWDGFNSGALRWQLYGDYKANRDKNYEAASAISNPQSDYDAYIAAYCKKVMDYHRKNKQGVRRGETDDENFQRQRGILQEILDELFVRQYMYENVEELNEKQINAISLLASGKTIEEVAKALNLNTNTIYRWKKTHTFKTALRDQQNLIFNNITLKLAEMGTDAVKVVYDIMNNASSENLRLKASMFIIDKIIQVEDNETIKRIDEIEFALLRGGKR